MVKVLRSLLRCIYLGWPEWSLTWSKHFCKTLHAGDLGAVTNSPQGILAPDHKKHFICLGNRMSFGLFSKSFIFPIADTFKYRRVDLQAMQLLPAWYSLIIRYQILYCCNNFLHHGNIGLFSHNFTLKWIPFGDSNQAAVWFSCLWILLYQNYLTNFF